MKQLRTPSSVDVAREAGVSQATVSYVFNGRKNGSVPEETRQHVLAAAKRLGYKRNQAARSLVMGRTQMVALVIPGYSISHGAAVLRHLEKLVKSFGYDIITSGASPESLARVLSWPVDGVLALDMPDQISEYISENPQNHMPIVSMGAFKNTNTDEVHVDLGPATQAAVGYLIASGRKRIVHLTTPATPYFTDVRRMMYEETMRENGLQPELLIVETGDRMTAREGVIRYITMNGWPDAFFCRNDDLAIGAYRGLRDMGVCIPDDMALVGCDGIEDTQYFDPAISTIVQPIPEMCRYAWDYLRARLDDPKRPREQISIQSQFEERGSSQ